MAEGPIFDYVILSVPPDVEQDDAFWKKLDDLASLQVMGQYKGKRPKAVVMEKAHWTITGDPDEVARTQPAHDCPTCHAGNEKAEAFLRDNPGRVLALGDLCYYEVW